MAWRRKHKAIVVGALAAGAFVTGMQAQEKRWFLATQWGNFKTAIISSVRPTTVSVTRPDDHGGQAVPCPKQSPRTMVALVLGQSHAANYVGERFESGGGVYIVWNGRCFVAQDPLIGAAHSFGNVWTLIGNNLVGSGAHDAVILAMTAVPDTSIRQWAPGGDLHPHLAQVISSLPDQYQITHIAVQQGEADLNRGTTYEAYLGEYRRLIEFLRMRMPAPIFVTVESGYCDTRGATLPARKHIQAAQLALINPSAGILPGPNMDLELNALADRYDGCHMSGVGARKLADAWGRAFSESNPAWIGPSSDRQPR